ncbi:putative enzyme [Klebsiella variicola]|uniref:Putative enzyme n=1 Tax=Klebsiella variicola TaxID=244366 RepID=A0A7H4MKY9_KLEVA|nr:putative enzyme [Klebsiella variicola]
MSRFRHVELQYASRLLNHGPTILITSYDAPSDRRNVMAAAWSNAGGIRPAAGGYRGG